MAEQLKYYKRAKDTFEDATEEFDDGAYTDAERKAKVIPPPPLFLTIPEPLPNGTMFTCVHVCCVHAWMFVCTCACLFSQDADKLFDQSAAHDHKLLCQELVTRSKQANVG